MIIWADISIGLGLSENIWFMSSHNWDWIWATMMR